MWQAYQEMNAVSSKNGKVIFKSTGKTKTSQILTKERAGRLTHPDFKTTKLQSTGWLWVSITTPKGRARSKASLNFVLQFREKVLETGSPQTKSHHIHTEINSKCIKILSAMNQKYKKSLKELAVGSSWYWIQQWIFWTLLLTIMDNKRQTR